jgi:peptidoglycan/LPS O-acetylase OafA/YrhL
MSDPVEPQVHLETHKRSRRVTELDALRGIACVVVVFAHYHVGSALVDRIGVYAQHAVELFFVISGFVICMTLQRQGVWPFVVARFARLYPAYLASVGVIAVLQYFWGQYADETYPPSVFIKNLMMWHSWFGTKSVTAVYWTLWAELKFYMLMVPVAYFGWQQRIERYAGAWLLFVVVYELVSSQFFDGGKLPVAHFAYGLSIPPQCHYFVSGIAFFRVWDKGWNRTRGILLAACFAREFMLFSDHRTPAVLLVWVVFGLLLANRLQVLNQRILLFLGHISYSMYLVHACVGSLVIAAMAGIDSPAVKFLAALTTSLVMAAVMAYAVEYPALAWLRGVLLPNRAAPPQANPVRVRASLGTDASNVAHLADHGD